MLGGDHGGGLGEREWQEAQLARERTRPGVSGRSVRRARNASASRR